MCALLMMIPIVSVSVVGIKAYWCGLRIYKKKEGNEKHYLEVPFFFLETNSYCVDKSIVTLY